MRENVEKYETNEITFDVIIFSKTQNHSIIKNQSVTILEIL